MAPHPPASETMPFTLMLGVGDADELYMVQPRSWECPCVWKASHSDAPAELHQAVKCLFAAGLRACLDVQYTTCVWTHETDPMGPDQWDGCQHALRGKPLGSQAFMALSRAHDWQLNWMLKPPLHFDGQIGRSGLVLIDHKLRCQAFLIPSVPRCLHARHPALQRLQELDVAFQSPSHARTFKMSSGRTFWDWLQCHALPDQHSRDSVQFHVWHAWHVCSAANGVVVTGPGEVTPCLHVPRQEDLWLDAVETFLRPLLPAVHAVRDMLPPELRPVWVSRWAALETGFQYVGLNVVAGRDWGLQQFTWEGTFDHSSGHHHGIHVRVDRNNAVGKLGCVCVLGNFCGFLQHLLPYGLSIHCPHLGMLWGDTSWLLHAVSPGAGIRLSWVLCNHAWVETGVRGEDGKRVAGRDAAFL